MTYIRVWLFFQRLFFIYLKKYWLLQIIWRNDLCYFIGRWEKT